MATSCFKSNSHSVSRQIVHAFMLLNLSALCSSFTVAGSSTGENRGEGTEIGMWGVINLLNVKGN